MRIAKPILLVTTPVGVIGGLYEGYRLAGNLVWLMAALIAFIGIAMFFVVRTIRRERTTNRNSRKSPGSPYKTGW